MYGSSTPIATPMETYPIHFHGNRFMSHDKSGKMYKTFKTRPEAERFRQKLIKKNILFM